METTLPKVLIVDDERVSLRNLEYVMKNEGYDVVSTQSGQNAVRHLSEQPFDVVLTDMRMAKVDGMQVLKRCRELQPDAEIILITGYATLESAVEIMREGAFSYIAKPAKLDDLRKVVKDALDKVALKKKRRDLTKTLEDVQGAVRIVTRDRAMEKPLEDARRIASVDANVFITGERGTGKKLFARYVHENSRRSAGPFISFHCGSGGEDILAYELFGQEQDAFMGPEPRKIGMIETASGGTLLLEDAVALPLPIQARLLQVLEDKALVRLGGTAPVAVDVRFIATASQSPIDASSRGSFRGDLYYRLNVASLHLPRLADRRDDIPLLAYFFLQAHAAAAQKPVTEIAEDALRFLLSYDFPGNVQELDNIIERAVTLASGSVIESAHLPAELKEMNIASFKTRSGKIPSLEEQEMMYIKWVLEETAGNKTLAAQILGIDRVSLWRKLKKYGLEDKE